MVNDLKDRLRISSEPLFSASGHFDHLLANAELMELEIENCVAFKEHPFRVVDDESMEELVASRRYNKVNVRNANGGLNSDKINRFLARFERGIEKGRVSMLMLARMADMDEKQLQSIYDAQIIINSGKNLRKNQKKE